MREVTMPVHMRFPPTFESAEQWAADHSLPHEDGLRAFFLTAALRVIARDEFFAKHFVVRGSTALWLRYDLPRVPRDIDLIATHYVTDVSPPLVKSRVVPRLKQALSDGCQKEFGRVPWARQMVSSLKFEVSAYRIPFQRGTVVVGHEASIDCCDLEFLISEKVVAFLTRFEAIPSRMKDLHDIAWASGQYGDVLSIKQIRAYVDRRLKHENLKVNTTPESFAEVRPSLAVRYKGLDDGRLDRLIPFEKSCETMLQFVRELSYFPSSKA